MIRTIRHHLEGLRWPAHRIRERAKLAILCQQLYGLRRAIRFFVEGLPP